jgi:hypothetical protein
MLGNELLDDAIFQRMEADHGQTAAGPARADWLLALAQAPEVRH